MTQLSLFTNTPDTSHMARRSDPATSHEAAANKVTTGSASSDRERILAVLRGSDDPLTGGEIAQGCGWGFDNARVMRRMKELERSGDVRAVGQRLCRSKVTNQTTYKAT